MKIFNIILIIFIILLAGLYYSDSILFKKYFNLSAYCSATKDCKQEYIFDKPYVYGLNSNDYTRFEYKEKDNSNPILLFGSSAINSGSENNIHSFAYLCSNYMKRSVIDYSFPGGGIQNMYFMSSNKEFYENTPKTNNVIYFLGEKDLDLLLTPISYIICENSFKLHYDIKDNKLVMSDYNNKFKNLIRSIYTVKYLTNLYVAHYINNFDNAKQITDTELLYFKETRKNFEENWNNKVKFTVLLYGNIPYSEILIRKLKEADFNVIDLEELTDVNLYNEEYMYKGIPSEKLWKILLPSMKPLII